MEDTKLNCFFVLLCAVYNRSQNIGLRPRNKLIKPKGVHVQFVSSEQPEFISVFIILTSFFIIYLRIEQGRNSGAAKLLPPLAFQGWGHPLGVCPNWK